MSYYDGGWKTFGVTDAIGKASRSLPPKSYSFSISYEGTRQEKVQHIGTDPNVVFNTVKVELRLKDSQGNPVDGGTSSYYAGGWRNFGTTGSGEASKQLLPGEYAFAMRYGGTNKQVTQNTMANPVVVFQF
ncbi:hypothetical protein [Candidatus Pristimantibacillus sp. PTI5]|uniref:hypothetical protein n=1 Tax=Candidatus Pristimantibacillus sp. PTI5 TaxID=3400422 RepID=UPI003B02D909